MKIFILSLVRKEKRLPGEISYVFGPDKLLLDMNRRFLNHDYYTDILSFPLSDVANVVAGEMYISVDRVRDNAATAGVPVKQELHRVIFHGLLHFCGYRDKTPANMREMRAKEDQYLKAYFDGFVSRGTKK